MQLNPNNNAFIYEFLCWEIYLPSILTLALQAKTAAFNFCIIIE
jgi:hypothetical protein